MGSYPPHRSNLFLQERLLLHLESSDLFRTSATGTVTCDTNANMADGDTVTISDGFRTVVYEYDKSSNGVAAGHVVWAAGTTADTVALSLQTAINATQPLLGTSDNGSGVLTITNNFPATYGNIALAKSSSSALAVTGMTGGQGLDGIAATSTAKRWKPENRNFKIDRVYLDMPKGFTQSTTAYWEISVNDSVNGILASWSTQTSAQGTLTADTPVDLVLASTPLVLAGNHMTVVATKTSTPANLPPFSLVIEGRYA